MSFKELQQQVFELVVRKNDSVSDHLAVAKTIAADTMTPPEYFRKLRVAFLSNFTIQGLPEVFKVRSVFHNLWTDTYLGPYNQYAQEILNPESGLNKFKPQLLYIVLDLVDEGINQVKDLAKTFHEETGARVVILDRWLSPQPEKNNRVLVFDFKDFINKIGEKDYWATKYQELGDLRLAPDAFSMLADAIMGYAVAVSGATKKCLVLDLDNTLWSGIVGEDGSDKVVPNEDIQKHALNLYNNGVILAINSRNNPEDALGVIENHPKMVLRKNHFAAQRINWQDKALNIKELAEELTLGTDSFVFVDDDHFNLLAVKSQHPEVATLTPDMLESYKGFESLYLTDEDKKRGQMYAEEFKRRQIQSSLSSVDDFIKDLKLEVTIREVKAESTIIPRLAQMTQKTNQFNMTTQRWSEDDIKACLLELGYRIWAVEAVDRFGDYGSVGFLSTSQNKNQWRIENFLMSCRILGRGIEKALLARLVAEARKEKVIDLLGIFIPTQKNKALCENFYPENNFSDPAKLSTTGRVDEYRWRYDVSMDYQYPPLIKVNFA